MQLLILLVILLQANCSLEQNCTPIVIWGGYGSSSIFYMERMSNFIKQAFPGVYVRMIADIVPVGGTFKDYMLGDYNSANIQIEAAAKLIADDENLRNGYIAIGISHGGLLLRTLAQRLSEPKIKLLLTLGSPHQGIFGRSEVCDLKKSALCHFFTRKFSSLAYNLFVQKFFSMASFWHDPYDPKSYMESCQFLPEINHELVDIKDEIKNFKQISKIILVKFTRDKIIAPPESAWFGFYKPYSIDIASYNETDFYKNNKLGFKDMVLNGKVEFVEIPEEHLIFTYEWLIEVLKKNMPKV